MSDSETDPSFAVLPTHLRNRIDRAFNTAIREADFGAQSENSPKKRKRDNITSSELQSAPSAPGGFILEDTPAPGGFLVDSEENNSYDPSSDEKVEQDYKGHKQIPLSLIPSALQLLDLQPDDDDVLSVFRNAATGWQTGARNQSRDGSEQYVSLKDWRAVCAALLDTSGVNDEDVDSNGDEEMNEVVESEGSGEEYVDSAEEDHVTPEESSDDEYQDGGFIRTRSKGKGKAPSTASAVKKRRPRKSTDLTDSEEEFSGQGRPITKRQKEECRKAFALFFPDVPDDQLDSQRIMIKDVTRVSGLLKEKITAEEIKEMLTEFSSSADMSMSLSDFEKMMIEAKMA